MNGTVFLQALDESTGNSERVTLSGDLKSLFEKMYGKSFGAVKWWCGVPGKDLAVVWQGTPWNGAEAYFLHFSFSDGRKW